MQLAQLYEAKNLKELMSKLTSEDVCRSYMEEMRWGGNIACPFCGSHNPYRLKNGRTFRCKNKECRKDFTVTVGTVFENSKLALSVWICAGYLLSAHKKGISSCQLARDLGIGQKAAWFVLHRLRLIMGLPEPEPLVNVVEVDETYVGGKFGNMNKARRKKAIEKGDNKTAVMGLVQRDGKAKLTVIGKDTFKDVIRKNVKKSAIISTDTHLGYWGLEKEFAAHGMVNHSENEYRNGYTIQIRLKGFSAYSRGLYLAHTTR
jgi:transposase-like protein